MGRPDLIAAILNHLGAVESHSGAYESAIAHQQESLEICEQFGYLDNLGITLDFLGFTLWCSGSDDCELILDYYDRGISILKDLGRIINVAMLLADKSLVVCDAGQIDRAIELGKQAVETARAAEIPEMIGLVLSHFGADLTCQGQYAEAWSILREALETLYTCKLHNMTTWTMYYVAQWRVAERTAARQSLTDEELQQVRAVLNCVIHHRITVHAFREKAIRLLESLPADDMKTDHTPLSLKEAVALALTWGESV